MHEAGYEYEIFTEEDQEWKPIKGYRWFISSESNKAYTTNRFNDPEQAVKAWAEHQQEKNPMLNKVFAVIVRKRGEEDPDKFIPLTVYGRVMIEFISNVTNNQVIKTDTKLSNLLYKSQSM